ncbi:MAG: RidA family protein [Actinomycetota bacterium]
MRLPEEGSRTVIEKRLAELGIELPPAAAPLASYVPVVISRNHAYVAGQVPIEDGRVLSVGHLGAELSIEQGQEATRRCALQALAALRDALGSLDRIKRIVKVDVFVASAPGFTDQPKVANGASDVLADVFGERGRHARAAVGVAELPLGASVEVALIAAVA